MSRSFGDAAAVEVGVNALPEITEMNLVESDKFMILASDGVWEFISNDEAVNIVMPHYQNNSAEKAAEALIRESMKKWQEEDTSIDDITCIIIFLNIQWSPQSQSKLIIMMMLSQVILIIHIIRKLIVINLSMFLLKLINNIK